MLTRIVTGTLAAAVALAAILWREPLGYLGLLLIILFLAMHELGRVVKVNFTDAIGMTLLVVAGSPIVRHRVDWMVWFGALWAVGTLYLVVREPKLICSYTGLFCWIVAGLLSATVLWSIQGKPVAAVFAPNLLLLALVPLWVGDSLAYFVGKAIGKHKLAPSISPNKTWEGAVANLVGCLAAAYAIGLWLKVPLPASIAVGLTTGILGQVGDLLQSRLKRLADVKDSGSILPGHGGVLDRLDSFLFSSYPSLLALYLLAPETFHVKQLPW